MSTTMAAKEIGAAWLAYVTETFQLEEGAIRAQVEEEYRRLAKHDDITKERELWRDYTDTLIERILQCPRELRSQFLAAVDVRSLAFVQDRIQCGTELLAALVQKGLMLNIEEGDAALPDFFRQMLLQKATA
jgi:hypothetical protein